MRKLRRRIYAHLIVTLFVGVTVSFLVFTAGWRSAFLHSFAGRLTHHVASQLSDKWNNRPAMARELKRISDELEVEITVRAATPQGALIASAGMPYPPLDAEELARVRKNDIVVQHRPRDFVAAPLVVDGEVVAVVEAAPITHAFRMPLRPLITIALIVIIAGVASGPLARRISLPIERMTDAMRRFGAGDLGARVPVLSKLWPERWRHHARRHFHRHHHHRHHQVDEIEQLTRAFNEMAERIEQLVRGQKELLANVSHELRSPLARIRVALELLPRDDKSAARLRDVEGDLGELDRLIEDVLTASRLEATGLPTHLDRVTVSEIFAALVARAQVDPLTAGKEVRARGSDGIVVMADGALIKRALWNLIENAAKYGAPPIVLSAAVDGNQLVLAVCDEGAGIAAEERARVFEPFYRADKARTPGNGGFGLGLTLARRVAEVHGGSIVAAAARSVAGIERGTSVTIKIPLA
jgi:two-component system OmpR family sensor kinase